MLKVGNLTKRFEGLIAVNNVSLNVEKDTIHGIIGPNGAGKTTFFNIISGVFAPTNGEIHYNGTSLIGLQPYQINRLGIARTYQNIRLFNKMSVVDNIKIGRHIKVKYGLLAGILKTSSQRREEAEIHIKALEILDMVGLAGKQDYQAKNLSYGEQRLLEISRALASEPALILLDEPAAGMNTKEKNDLVNLIYRIKALGITILIVEHDMKLVMGICDRISVLNYGKLIAEGTPSYIQNQDVVIEAYLGGSAR